MSTPDHDLTAIGARLPGPPRVLTVCLGNICRSPVAEAAIREAAEELDVDLEVDSAGTSDWNVGRPPDSTMAAVARAAGLDLRGSARQVTVDDLDRFDLVVVMDRSNLAAVRALGDGDARAQVRLLRSFDPDADTDEVPDPWGGPRPGFEDVMTMIRPAARGVVEWLRERR